MECVHLCLRPHMELTVFLNCGLIFIVIKKFVVVESNTNSCTITQPVSGMLFVIRVLMREIMNGDHKTKNVAVIVARSLLMRKLRKFTFAAFSFSILEIVLLY